MSLQYDSPTTINLEQYSIETQDKFKVTRMLCNKPGAPTAAEYVTEL